MSLGSIGLAAPPGPAGGLHVSTALVIVVILLALLSAFAIIGWRAPDRSPGADTKRQRERIED